MNSKFRENSINEFFNSRAFTILTAIALVVVTYLDFIGGSDGIATNNGRGVFFHSAAEWIADPQLSMWVNVASVLMIGFCTIVMNKLFNFMRSVTTIFTSTFLLLELASPFNTVRFFSGTLLCLVIVLISFVLFASFQNKRSQRSIFASFALLSFFTLSQYAFLYLLVALLLGYVLMQSINFRGFLAMILGIVTPYWIVLGLGIADFSDFSLPAYNSIWKALATPQMHLNIAGIAIIAALTIALTFFNLIKIMNYKTQVRAYNGFFVVLAITSTIMLAADYRNSFLYVPILNLCFGVQLGHFYTLNNYIRRYLLMFALIVAVIAIHAMQIAF